MNTPITSGPAMMLKALGIDPQKAMDMISSLQKAGNDLTKAVEAFGVQLEAQRNETALYFEEMRADMARIETLLQEQRQTGVTENAEREDRPANGFGDAGPGDGKSDHGGSGGAAAGAAPGEIAQ